MMRNLDSFFRFVFYFYTAFRSNLVCFSRGRYTMKGGSRSRGQRVKITLFQSCLKMLRKILGWLQKNVLFLLPPSQNWFLGWVQVQRGGGENFIALRLITQKSTSEIFRWSPKNFFLSRKSLETGVWGGFKSRSDGVKFTFVVHKLSRNNQKK